jgi:adenylate cyclase
VALAGTLAVWRPWAVPPDLQEATGTELTPARQAAVAAGKILSPRLPRAPTPLGGAVMVLPVENASNDPRQGYFADGLTEDLISALARTSNLSVIGRYTTFTLKDTPTDIPVLSQSLGVRFLLKGSVRRGNDRLLLNVQMIDTVTEQSLWSVSYDRPLDELFTVQAELADRVITSVLPQGSSRIPSPARALSAGTLNAYDLSLHARLREGVVDHASAQSARTLLERAIEIDPGYIPAYQQLFRVVNLFLTHPWTSEFNSTATASRMLELATRAVSLDPKDPHSRAIYAEGLTLVGQHGTASAQIDAVVTSATTDADLLRAAAIISARTGELERGVSLLKRAMKLDPAAGVPHWAEPLASQLYFQGNYAESAEVSSHCVRRNPRYSSCRLWYAAALAQAGKLDEARQAAGEAVAQYPELSLRDAVLREGIGYREPEHARHYGEGLRKAGLPH